MVVDELASRSNGLQRSVSALSGRTICEGSCSSLAQVDVAADEPQCVVGWRVGESIGLAVERWKEQRHDLDQAADGGEGQSDQQ
jgi:hypothetical protein